jgi:catechol 2,3-dioxygenase-like lactoylglutathione lyase family enzyme
MKLDHVSLTVSDRARSAAFYGRHFGLGERVHEDEHLLILGESGGGAGAGSLLALSVGEPAAHGLPRTNHFGFRAADGDEVRAARERFRAAGVEETEWQDSHGFVRVQVLDPDGYRVEMYAH